MRVLGIDPGSRKTGLGVVESPDNYDGLKLVAYECLQMSESQVAARLNKIFRGVISAIEKYQPDAVAIEKVFMAKNANAALVLGQAMGSAMCAAVAAGKAVTEYSALQIKNAVVGTGRAQKDQVQHMVRALLGLSATPDNDAADALACAICHIHTIQVAEKLNRAQV